MRILLLGEYSNVHWTLAKGLRTLGHEVTVASNGDFWKNYPRDIDLARHEGPLGGAMLMCRIAANLPRMRGYDIVQLINPMFMELKAERLFPIYNFLRRHNGKVILGAFGMDYYWVHENITRKPFRYGDFNIGDTLRDTPDTRKEKADWLCTPKQRLNELIAHDSDSIVAGLYEYYECYHPLFPDKTQFIPFPIISKDVTIGPRESSQPLRLFIGVNKPRSAYKGTDIMLRAARDAARDYPDKIKLSVAENIPFAEYTRMMEGSDAILDQLYSYTPSMNPLEAMSRGIICIGGGEPENYAILHEDRLRPIVNVLPTYESVYNAIVDLAARQQDITTMQRQSVEYIRKHHDYIKVAREYEALYQCAL